MVLPVEAEAKVVNEMPLEDRLLLPTHLDSVTFDGRAIGRAVAAGVSTAVASWSARPLEQQSVPCFSVSGR